MQNRAAKAPGREKLVVFTMILVFSLAGMALIAYSTVWGPGVNSDSVYYILSADNWVNGLGFGLPWGSGRFLAYAGNPPFYPMLVALLELAGMGMVAAARWVGIMAFGGTILAVGLLGYKASRSVLLSVGLTLLVLSSSIVLDLFTRAISEPAFFLTGLSGALWFLWYLETGRLRELVPAALLVSAAFLTRYPAVSLVLAAGLCMLFLSKVPWRKRLTHALLYAALTLLPMLAWLSWSFTQTGEVGERVFAPFSGLAPKLVAFRLRAAEIGWGWLPWIGKSSVSYNTHKVVFGIGLLLLAGWTAMVFTRNLRNAALRDSNRPLLRWVAFFMLFCLLFSLVYLLGYALTIPTPDLNERLFSPLYFSGLFTLLGLLEVTSRSWQAPRWLKVLPWILVLLVGVQDLPQTLRTAQSLHQDGLGYTGRQWSQSPLIAAVRLLPPDIPIITNEADAVLFLTGRPAVWLPDVIASQPSTTFTRFGDSPENTREEVFFRERGGALVIFPSVTRQLSSLYADQTQERLETLINGLVEYTGVGPYEAIYFYDAQSLP